MALQPDAIAAICADESVTYDQLNRQANQLAHYLQRRGVRPEVTVGLCMKRSLAIVVSILGILKAGGAYVPLDPTYPDERLTFMLQDANLLYLVTESTLRAALPTVQAQIICLDIDAPLISQEPCENPASGVLVDNLAYVFYTSGSTGRPKGIALQHRGVVNNLVDLNSRFAVGPGDSVLVISSLSFDMSIYEILGVLGVGGRLVVPVALKERDPPHWADLLVQHQITLWNSAPALLEMLIAYVAERPSLWPRSLRLALLGGDWIHVALPDKLKVLAEGIQVISLGGATEASIHSTIYPVEEGDATWKSIPYGRPMANQSAYILDAAQQIVPIGVEGELCLGGVGLARGYFNRPELTAERFIPHPYCSKPGERLYRTGDLARYLPDGNIELLGRIDFQVKIRGLRIELGEIVAALQQHTAIRDAVVLAREDEPGNKRLVAYLVPQTKEGPGASELRHFLQQTLPEYMIPVAFVQLQALPLSPNGKIDRRSLPAPKTTNPALETEFVAPGTPLEEVIAAIWADVLNLKQVSAHDNFFELGGDSLHAIRIISRLQEAFTPELSLAHLLEAATVAKQAELLEIMSSETGQDFTKIAQTFLWLSQLSDEEVEAMLAERTSGLLETEEEL